MSVKNYFRRHAYKWHRVTSMVVALPIVLWTISGFLHPVMNMLKPGVKEAALYRNPIDLSKVKLTGKEALKRNGIDSFSRIQLVHFKGEYYYQLRMPGADSLSYISAVDGTWLHEGDQHYASFLATQYLPARGKENNNASKQLQGNITGSTVYDGHEIISVQLVTQFNDEYKPSNKLVPVYRVAFRRADGLRLFVETSTGRLATAMDHKRYWYTRFFSLAHSWSFLNETGVVKNIIIGGFSLLCLLSSLLGLYIYNISRQKISIAKKQPLKYMHRIMGNAFAVTTMLYAFSGGWHSLHKLSAQSPRKTMKQEQFTTGGLHLDIHRLSSFIYATEMPINLSMVKMHATSYYQLTVMQDRKVYRKYIHAGTEALLPRSDELYGCYLACIYSGKKTSSIVHSSLVTSFSHHYSTMNKRLPVMEVGYEDGAHYYVETSTGALAAVVQEKDKKERAAFSYLHMHHYWETLLGKNPGKALRNGFLILTTLGLIFLAWSGMVMYMKRRKKIHDR